MEIDLTDISTAASQAGGAETVLLQSKESAVKTTSITPSESLLEQLFLNFILLSESSDDMIREYAPGLINIYLDGASGWITETKCRNLRALGFLFERSSRSASSATGNPTADALPQILSVLGPAVTSQVFYFFCMIMFTNHV
jgi:hypothetical protein